MKKHLRTLGFLMALLAVMLACQIPTSNPTPNTGLIQTQTALEETLAAINNPAPANTLEPPPAEVIQPTNVPATGTGLSQQELQAKIASARVLIYEDVVQDTDYLPIASKAVEKITSNFTYVGDAMGDFKTNMQSSKKWDLIIVASEFSDDIQGDYWTTIQQQVDKNQAALIVENNYLDEIAPNEIKPLLQECGIDYQQTWELDEDSQPSDSAIFWVVKDSPVFNIPNVVDPLTSSSNDGMDTAGDFVKLTSNPGATILASHKQADTTDMGLITSCLKGTVIFQTFRTHDYDANSMAALWQNYITYVLTNHFQTIR